MNAQIILGSTVLATIFSTVISFIISRRQGSLQYITGERKEWREQIRNIAYNLNNASYGKTLKILIELKVRINGFGMNRKNCMEDAHIWEVIHEIEKEKPSNEILNRRQKQLIEYISLLLKYDWECSKREIRGNTYKVLSMIIFAGTGIYFASLIFMCREYTVLTKFHLATVSCIFILIVIALVFLLCQEAGFLCSNMVKGNLKNKESKNVLIYVKLIWVVSTMVLTCGYAKIITGLFKLLSDIRYTSLSIILLIAMFIFGLVFLYMSKEPIFELQHRYIDEIQKIRSRKSR